MVSGKHIDQANHRGGFYGDLKLGLRPALLVVDFQKGFTQPKLSSLAGDFDEAINTTCEIIKSLHGKMPIIFTICGYKSKFEAGRWIEKCSALEDLILGTEACELDIINCAAGFAASKRQITVARCARRPTLRRGAAEYRCGWSLR